jgi:two-component system, chemotaxis family, protein-glutamate methylesterase/glutaminase
MEKVFLLPGEAAWTRTPKEIATLLGSCVAVCLHDRHAKAGGMNHYMLPSPGPGGAMRMAPGKYGDQAIDALIEVACRSGSRKGSLIASLFGGGSVVGHLESLQEMAEESIGGKNIEVARIKLREHGIPVDREDVGGRFGRKIYMDAAKNTFTVRRILPSEKTEAQARARQRFKNRGIRVLIIDDSATVRRVLRKGLENTPDIEVCGEAANPYEARERILECDPDVLCLDIIMPRMDGHTFLRKIMKYKPIPAVIVSTIAKKGSEMRENVLKAGAVDVIDKEELDLYKGVEYVERILAQKLRRAAKTPVSRIG